MNIRELKEIIKDFPDNAEVLIRAPDHEYSDAQLWGTTALYDKGGTTRTEDYIDDGVIGQKTEYGERVRALCLA